MEFRERERWAPRRRRLPTKVFATFAIFSISRDFSTARRSARRAEKGKRICVPVFVGLHSTLWFRPNDVTAYIGKVKRRYESLSSRRARTSLFRESASARRPFFPSTITFPSLMDRIVRAVSRWATKRGKCVSGSRWRLLPSDFRFSMIYEFPKDTEKAENYAGTISETTLAQVYVATRNVRFTK